MEPSTLIRYLFKIKFSQNPAVTVDFPGIGTRAVSVFQISAKSVK